MTTNGNKTLDGRTLYIPSMTQSGARLLAATFRSFGINAHICPPSDERTLELGSKYSSGEECFPEKITLGDFLKLAEQDGFDPAKTAFLMPTANGPCRFGQYMPLLQKVVNELGYEDVLIFSPSSSTGYGVGGTDFFKRAWLAVIAADILRKMLLKTRPYETVKGTTDRVYEEALQSCERVLEREQESFGNMVHTLRDELVTQRDRFRAIDAKYVKGKPLLAVVGEIFCRHNRFANEYMLRKLEEHGAETWLADVGEWVFYTDWSRMDNMKRQGKGISVDMAVAKIKGSIMKKHEHTLLDPFKDDFKGYEEPHDVSEIVEYAEPYLPARGALGEMSLSLGRAAYCYHKGVDGIVDISPFSCMNGIVSEAVYPSFSRDHNNIPCRVFYFDGVNLDMDRDVGIFVELVKGYMQRKKVDRDYNHSFVD